MNPDNNKNGFLISYMTLRQSIGWLGILLAPVLLTGNYLLSLFTDFEAGCNPFKSSISLYYYTGMGEVFTGTLCAVALFLFCYRGYEKIDSVLCNIAGTFALGVVLFPTYENPLQCNLRTYNSTALFGGIHLAMAGLLFLTLAYISYFLFTKSKFSKIPLESQKNKRNKVYKTCGILMVLFLIAIAIYKLFLNDTFLKNYNPVFCLEAFILFVFGISWLTKGELFLKDR